MYAGCVIYTKTAQNKVHSTKDEFSAQNTTI